MSKRATAFTRETQKEIDAFAYGSKSNKSLRYSLTALATLAALALPFANHYIAIPHARIIIPILSPALAITPFGSKQKITQPRTLYTNNLKNWNFGKAGTKSLNQRSGAEAAQLQQVGRYRRIQNLGCPAQPKTNSSDCLGIPFPLPNSSSCEPMYGDL